MKKYLFKFKGLFALRCTTVIINSIVGVSLAFILKIIIDAATSNNLNLIYKAGILSIIYLIVSFTFDLFTMFVRTKYLKKTMSSLKDDLFNSIINKDIKSFNEENSAKYISVLTNDIKIIEDDYFSSIFNLLNYLTAFIFALYSLAKISLEITILILVMGLITFIIPNFFSKKLVNNKDLYSKSLALFITKIKDILSGFEIVKNFNLYSKMNSIFHSYNIKSERQKQVYTLWENFLNILANTLGFSMFFICLVMGGFLVINGKISLGAMMAATQLMNNLVNPLSQSIGIINKVKSIKKISEKIDSILSNNTESNTYSIESKNDSKFLDSIEIKNVNFGYTNNKQILNNINLIFNRGKKYAIVGTSGCGKSTLLKLLLKYYDNFTGDIYIDGLNLNSLSEKYIYNNMSIIQQNVFIFDGTIKDNIALYQEYTDEDIFDVLKIAGLSDLVKNLPNGIHEYIGENGNKLSGGEKQRIAIARSLLRKTPIIMLDESTSSLDNETSYSIEKSILSINNMTLISITHKLIKDLLKYYDEIIVMKNGTIIEVGNFNELINKKKYFYSLYNIEEGINTEKSDDVINI